MTVSGALLSRQNLISTFLGYSMTTFFMLTTTSAGFLVSIVAFIPFVLLYLPLGALVIRGLPSESRDAIPWGVLAAVACGFLVAGVAVHLARG